MPTPCRPSPPGARWLSRSAASPRATESGRTVAAVLCVLLVLVAVVLAGPARGGHAAHVDREALAQRREKLFAELVELEQQRRGEGERAPAPTAAWPTSGASW